MAEQTPFRNIDPRIWKEFIGGSFTVPKLHSRVYYFPLGHLEDSPKAPSAETLSLLRPFILCTVSSVGILVDHETGQIFAKLLLAPVIDATVVDDVEASNQGDHVVSYAKTLTEKTVINAVKLAEKNMPFEVECYPRVNGFDFVVGDKVVEDSMKIDWHPGMRVVYKVKKPSMGRSTFHGKISALSPPSTHPWRMLEVEWDEPNVSKNLKHVSPWQVEPDFSIPIEMLRVAQGVDLLIDTERMSSIWIVDFSNFSMESLYQTLLNVDGNEVEDTQPS